MKFTHIIYTVLFSFIGCLCMAQPTATLKPNFKNSTYNANITDSEKSEIQKQWEIDDAKIQAYAKANNITDIYWLDSGLYYTGKKQGNGEIPNINSVVKVKYNLTTLDGSAVWSTIKTGGTEVRALGDFVYGVAEGLQLLKPGGKIKLLIPSALAYGTKGWGKKIPPNTCIVYDIELIEVFN